MTKKSSPPDTQNPPIGKPARSKHRTWVQTERAAHEAWAMLTLKHPRAAMLLHHLVARMGDKNAVVASQKTLARLMGVNERTVRRAVVDLSEGRWIQVVRLNGPGTVSAYVVNDRVAWGQDRGSMHKVSTFSATVVADADDQPEGSLTHDDLRQIPALYPGDQQMPSGPGEDPPSQPALDGMEPDLPTIFRDDDGLEWEVDTSTGEAQQRIGDASNKGKA